MAIKTYHRGQG